MNVQFAMVDGVRMATLPADEFDRLVEAAEDRAELNVAEAAAARRDGGEEYVPADVAYRILDGESPVRVWRAHRGMTLERLGSFAGIKPAYLSEIERGVKRGTPAVWRKLATALNVDVDDIMP